HRNSRLLTSWTESVEHQELFLSQGCFCVSEEIAQYVRSIDYPGQCRVVPNGVDTGQFKPDSQIKREIRARLSIPDSSTVIGYVGSFKQWHNLPLTVDVIKHLRDQGFDVCLLLIGSGLEKDATLDYCRLQGVLETVVSLDSIAHDDIHNYLGAMDIALMTYNTSQSFYFSPLKMFEYMAMGIPIVSTGIGQIADILGNNDAGILIDDPDISTFSQAIENLIREPELLAHYAKQSRDLAVNEYSWIHNAQRIVDLCSAVRQP
ncbi:MAG: glycosyltransferase family 4 protein, partial [Pseudomonadota bacterium]